MADDEITPASGKARPTGHGVPNRRHRGKKRGLANSPGPREWSEGAAEAEVAMAGGMELSGARETSPTSHESPN